MFFSSKIKALLLVLSTGLAGASFSKWGDPPAAQRAPVQKRDAGIWKSQTTGKEYRVRIEGDRFFADWINLPPAAAQHGAYIRTVCRRNGSKWVGTSSIFMPCTIGEGTAEHIADTCHVTLQIEINSLSKDRITGRGQSLRKFDCRSCKVLETGWGNFEWVPAK